MGTDVAWADPDAFVAVTATRSVLPTSTCCSGNVCAVAPLIVEQLLPFWSQRLHAYAKLVGVLLHVPFAAVSVEPG